MKFELKDALESYHAISELSSLPLDGPTIFKVASLQYALKKAHDIFTEAKNKVATAKGLSEFMDRRTGAINAPKGKEVEIEELIQEVEKLGDMEIEIDIDSNGLLKKTEFDKNKNIPPRLLIPLLPWAFIKDG
jgi:hypothetical protein